MGKKRNFKKEHDCPVTEKFSTKSYVAGLIRTELHNAWWSMENGMTIAKSNNVEDLQIIASRLLQVQTILELVNKELVGYQAKMKLGKLAHVEEAAAKGQC